MVAAKTIVLATLIAISGWFHDGLKALQEKKYDAAIENLTKVYEKDVPGNEFRKLALYFRAEALAGKGDKAKALKDLEQLAQMAPDKELMGRTVDLYKGLGGDPKNLNPVASPKEIWQTFYEACKQGNLKDVRSLATGDMKRMLDGKRGDVANELKREFNRRKITVREEVIGKGDAEGTASLKLTTDKDDPPVNLLLVFDKVRNTWLISGFQERGRQVPNRARLENVSKLKMLGLAIKQYAMDHDDRFPGKLSELMDDDYLTEEECFTWKHPTTGKEQPFLYRKGLTDNDDADSMVVAAPQVVDGKREVLYLDGHVMTEKESEFQAKLKQQRWQLKGDTKNVKVPEELAKKVQALVKQLASPKFKERKAARKALKEMGADAFPVLEKYQDHEDPEVRLTVRGLLRGE